MPFTVADQSKEREHLSQAEGRPDVGLRPSALFGHPYLHAVLATSLLLPLQGAAQVPAAGSKSASSGFGVMLTVRPAFRVLETKAVPGGYQYRVWTNMKTVQLNGAEYRIERVGETTLVVPGALIEPPVQPSP